MKYTAEYTDKTGSHKIDNDSLPILSKMLNNISKLGLLIRDWYIVDNKYGTFEEIGHGI